MSIEQIEIIILACLVAVTCALPGVFLVLRKVSLMSDAISHAILLGIVGAFFITKNLNSPLLVVGATLTGILTVSLTELVINTRKLKEDAAIGLVFPVLFSLGVILINLYATNVHIDTDCVLLGEIAFAPFNRMTISGQDWGPVGFWTTGGALLLNALFIGIFYKELKIATFDAGLAAALGFIPGLLHYALMTIVSVTCVASFETVGSILVVALMIAPPAAAYLLTNSLSRMLSLSALIGVASAISGYFFAYHFDTSIAGAMATMSGVIFLGVWLFAPERGLLARFVISRFQKFDFGTQMLLVHLYQSEYLNADTTEMIVSHMKDHMLWEQEYTDEVIAQSLEQGLIQREGQRLSLTTYGREKAKIALTRV